MHALRRPDQRPEPARGRAQARVRARVPDERTAQPVTRWLFEGETFASEEDARRVREDKVRSIARGFYVDLPAALRARKEDDRLGR